MSRDLCQADRSGSGEPVSPSALQSGLNAEAFNEAAHDWAWEIVNEFVGEEHIIETYPGAALNLSWAIARLVVEKATPSQSQIEEPQRGDTVTAEQREAGLTQNFEAKAQEIALTYFDQYDHNYMGRIAGIMAAISSALSTAYEEGKAAISQHVDAAVRAEMEACAKRVEALPRNMQQLLLQMGEMNAQERRSVTAALNLAAFAIRSRGNANGRASQEGKQDSTPGEAQNPISKPLG
jgi:hypothetical protein